MDRKLFFKLAAIGLLTLLLLIPLALIEGQIVQRSNRQAEVRNNIAQTAAGAQTLVGPVLAIRYRELLPPETTRDPASGRESTVRKQVQRTLFLPAEQLDIRGQAAVESRSRGIYQARLFHLDLEVQGRIPVPAHLGLDPRTDILEAQADLVLGLSDLRGMDNDPEVAVNGVKFRFRAGASPDLPGQQVAIPLGRLDLGATRFDFSFPLKLTGTERLAIAPTADANRISIDSDWRHPSFQGRFLPRTRQVSEAGFEARWEVSHLARNFDNALRANGGSGETLEICFLEPVNIYLQSERAVKYGSLFIVLTFAAFFLGEILRRRPMHFMQYLLVGLALAVFFLLLIALSEHLPFAWAYLASAAGCIGLITAYLSGVFGGTRPALAFGAGFTGLYGVLYGVLLSEDNSLLMGSLLLFLALGAIMLTTRKVDWYGVGAARPAQPGE